MFDLMETGKLISLIHICTAVTGMLTGAWVLLAKKGTQLHKIVGYCFAIAMLLVNATALLLYNLTGSFNFLHVFALVSLSGISLGMYYVIRKPNQNWLQYHIRWMNAAALGVWAAAVAEFTVRVLPLYLTPQTIIYLAIGVGIVFFFLIGYTNYRAIARYAPKKTALDTKK